MLKALNTRDCYVGKGGVLFASRYIKDGPGNSYTLGFVDSKYVGKLYRKLRTIIGCLNGQILEVTGRPVDQNNSVLITALYVQIDYRTIVVPSQDRYQQALQTIAGVLAPWIFAILLDDIVKPVLYTIHNTTLGPKVLGNYKQTANIEGEGLLEIASLSSLDLSIAGVIIQGGDSIDRYIAYLLVEVVIRPDLFVSSEETNRLAEEADLGRQNVYLGRINIYSNRRQFLLQAETVFTLGRVTLGVNTIQRDKSVS